MFRPPSILFRQTFTSPIRPQFSPFVFQITSLSHQIRGIAVFQPRRARSRKTHKGVIPCKIGGSTKGTTLQYGEYGLRLVDQGRRLSAKQLQTADSILRKALKHVKGIRIYYRFSCGKAVCKKGNEVRMGKGKGSFDHWGCLVQAGKMMFEISSPELRVEDARDALNAAGKAIPGPVQFVDKSKLKLPAIVGLSQSPEFHAGFKVEGSIDKKIRSEKQPPIVISKQLAERKLTKLRKGLVRG